MLAPPLRSPVYLINKMVADEDVDDFIEEKDDDPPGLGCALEVFAEHEEVLKIIDKLKSIHEDEHAVEVTSERFVYVLDLYQEQPHLLDPYLDSMISSIMNIIRDKENKKSLKNIAFGYVKHIMKVRGFKTVVRHLPHEVFDLEPVLQMLENEESKERPSDSSYVLLLWLSIIVKVPFHMSRFDDYTVEEADKRKTVSERIIDICKSYISGNVYFMTPASFLTAHFITRSDIHAVHLNDFLNWICQAITNEHTGRETVNVLNAMATLAAILKHGKREDLLPYAKPILRKVLESGLKSSEKTLYRKYVMKIVQRIGLVFLKPKVALWRYQRGSRSLADNLKTSDSRSNPDGDSNATENVPEMEEFYIPDEIEEVIECLLQGLRDSETIIRWSAAKGVGRVTGRLPKELADEVVESVLELLSPNEQDGAWHGGCLTLAELGRRGLLLPQRLPIVVPLLLEALVYEESRGYFSIGEHVRDAACYVAWSFARAYEAHILKPYVNAIASGLLIVSLFDREVKCRRAASAAFQENVGRQGTFPHGIDILTTADYFSVGVRRNSFLKLSVYVGQFEEYTIPLIDHLVQKKVDHWDVAIRELTSSALFNMTPLNPDYMLNCVVDALRKKTRSIDLNCRHGAVIAIAEVIHALKLLNREIPPDVTDELRDLVNFYRENNYLSGLGGEILRQGFCRFIEKCSLSQIPYHGMKVIDDWQQLIDECLLSDVEIIRTKAVAALNPFCVEYYGRDEEDVIRKRNAVVGRYVGELLSPNQSARIGFSSAIGSLPRFMTVDKVVSVISALLESLKITEYTSKWAESRRHVIKALISVVSKCGVESISDDEVVGEENMVATVGCKTTVLPQSPSRHIWKIFKALLVALEDYANDSRGDVGAWVREASMSGLEKMVIMIAKSRKDMLNEALMTTIIGGIGKQAVERIDRTRFHAGKVFSTIIHHKDPVIPNIPHHTELIKIFPEDYLKKEFIRERESESFHKFAKMLTFPCYTHYVMEGFMISVGGITESLVKFASTALFSCLKSIEDLNELNRICSSILDIFEYHQHDNRVTKSMFSSLDRLIGSGAIRPVFEDKNSNFAEELLRLTKIETTNLRDYRKLVNSMDLYCQFVQVKGKVSKRALSQMSVFLCHKVKSVRKGASRKLYECLLLYGDCLSLPDENLDEAMTLLSDTRWDNEPNEIRETRNRLCELLNISVPRLNKPNPQNNPQIPNVMSGTTSPTGED